MAQPGSIFRKGCDFATWKYKMKPTDRSNPTQLEKLHPFVTDPAYFEERANGLVSVQRSGLAGALRLIQEFHPRFAGAGTEEISRADFTVADAHLVLARQHGHDTWRKFVNRLSKLSRDASSEPFIAAFQAIEAGKLDTLSALLKREPWLVGARGTNGNSLLNLAGGCKQLAASKILLAAGADPNLGNDRGWTPLHQAAYSNQSDLAQLLLGAGAATDVSAHGDGGTPLVQALFWGHDAMADLLADHGITPHNLRVAAGLGRNDLMQEFFNSDGSLAPDAGSHRAFYRPHSGFPIWQPSGNRQKILDEAFVYASRNGRVDALEFLLRHGANIDGDPYRGTALI